GGIEPLKLANQNVVQDDPRFAAAHPNRIIGRDVFPARFRGIADKRILHRALFSSDRHPLSLPPHFLPSRAHVADRSSGPVVACETTPRATVYPALRPASSRQLPQVSPLFSVVPLSPVRARQGLEGLECLRRASAFRLWPHLSETSTSLSQ